MHCMEKVNNTIIWPKHHYYFITDASYRYWAIYMKPRDKYKTRFIIPYGLYAYLRMSKRLIGVLHTYSQFSNMVFDHLPKINTIRVEPSLIKDHDD